MGETPVMGLHPEYHSSSSQEEAVLSQDDEDATGSIGMLLVKKTGPSGK